MAVCTLAKLPITLCAAHGVKLPARTTKGEAFTRILLCSSCLHRNRRQSREGETFTCILLYISGLSPKGEEVKAKSRKTPDAYAREESEWK